MKKLLTICAAALVAFAMTGCEKTGTIEGEVCDAFTGKALEMPTIWIDSTIYSTLKDKYKYKQELRKGQFKFTKFSPAAPSTSRAATWSPRPKKIRTPS